MAQDDYEAEVLVGALQVVASVLVIVTVSLVAKQEVVVDEKQVVDYTCTPVVIVALNQAGLVA